MGGAGAPAASLGRWFLEEGFRASGFLVTPELKVPPSASALAGKGSGDPGLPLGPAFCCRRLGHVPRSQNPPWRLLPRPGSFFSSILLPAPSFPFAASLILSSSPHEVPPSSC